MSNEVATAKAGEIARESQSETSQMLSQIMTVILDHEVPEERLKILLALQKELVADQRRSAFNAALARAQSAFPRIEQRGRIKVYSKSIRDKAETMGEAAYVGQTPQQSTPYAKWDDVRDGITPALSANGLHLSFDYETIPVGTEGSYLIVVIGTLKHNDGWEQTVRSPPLKHDSTGSKNSVQAIKSSNTYGKRMVAEALVNYSSHLGDDDDGSGAGVGESVADKITSDQVTALAKEIAAQGGKTLEGVLTFFGIDKLADLPADRFAECAERLAQRRVAAGAKMAVVPKG